MYLSLSLTIEFFNFVIVQVHTLQWSLDTAQEILEEFQLKFQAEIDAGLEGDKYQFHSYSSLGLENIMKSFSKLSYGNVFIGYIIMVSWKFRGFLKTNFGDFCNILNTCFS